MRNDFDSEHYVSSGFHYLRCDPKIVWSFMANVSKWRLWNPFIVSVSSDDELRAGSLVSWRNGGFEQSSQITEYIPDEKIVMTDFAKGGPSTHVWRVGRVAEGSLVELSASYGS
jgi:hypothetical protein